MPRVTPSNRPARDVPQRPSRLKLMLRRQRKFVRPAIWGVAGFGAVLAVLLLAHSFQPGGTLDRLRTAMAAATNMRIEHIKFDGNVKTPEALLRAALGVHEGDPMLGFSLEGARERIESISWVESAAIARKLPGLLEVDIRERSPIAVWQFEGKFKLIDQNGTVVTNENVAAFASLPLVVGAGAQQAANALLKALDTQPALRPYIMAAVRVGERRWNLRMKNGTDVLLPEGAEQQALARLAELESQDQLLERPLAVIDMRLADRLVVRPAPAPATAATPQGKKA